MFFFFSFYLLFIADGLLGDTERLGRVVDSILERTNCNIWLPLWQMTANAERETLRVITARLVLFVVRVRAFHAVGALQTQYPKIQSFERLKTRVRVCRQIASAQQRQLAATFATPALSG